MGFGMFGDRLIFDDLLTGDVHFAGKLGVGKPGPTNFLGRKSGKNRMEYMES